MPGVALLLALVLGDLPSTGGAPGAQEPFPAAGELIRQVLKSQRTAEKRFDSYTFDRREEVTAYRSDGGVKEIRTSLFYVFAGPGPDGASRELVEVDGRPATEKEKRAAAEKDAKSKRRLEERAAARAAEKQVVGGDEDDPTIGPRRLSDLLRRFDVRVSGKENLSGRAAWVVEFSPRPGVPERGLRDRALGVLAGRAWIDAEDLQIRSVEAYLIRPFKVAEGLFANVTRADVTYEAGAVVPGYWFPARISLRVSGKKALFFRLDTGYRFELSHFRNFAVETESTVSAPR
jgi:hypothetical protein